MRYVSLSAARVQGSQDRTPPHAIRTAYAEVKKPTLETKIRTSTALATCFRKFDQMKNIYVTQPPIFAEKQNPKTRSNFDRGAFHNSLCS